MKKIIVMLAVVFATNLFSIETEEDVSKLERVLNTPIKCSNSEQLSASIETLFNQIDGLDKFMKVFKDNVEALTYKKTFELMEKFPNKKNKEIKSLIKSGVEMEVVNYFNNKSITQVMNESIKIKKMGIEYLDKITKKQVKKIKIDVSYIVSGLNIEDMNKSINIIISKIEVDPIKIKFENSLKEIKERVGEKEMPFYLQGRTVYDIIKDSKNEGNI